MHSDAENACLNGKCRNDAFKMVSCFSGSRKEDRTSRDDIAEETMLDSEKLMKSEKDVVVDEARRRSANVQMLRQVILLGCCRIHVIAHFFLHT